MNIIENQRLNEELKQKIEKGIQNFLQENRITVLAVNGKLLTSTDLGKTQNLSAIATNKILNKAGILEENTDPDRTSKWKITKEGRQYAVTPIKFTVSIENDNTIIVHLKEENPKWTEKLKEKFTEIVKQYNQSDDTTENEIREDAGIYYEIIHSNEPPKLRPMTYTVYSKNMEVAEDGEK